MNHKISVFNIKRFRKCIFKSNTHSSGPAVLLKHIIVGSHNIEQNFGCRKLHKHSVTRMLLFTNFLFLEPNHAVMELPIYAQRDITKYNKKYDRECILKKVLRVYVLFHEFCNCIIPPPPLMGLRREENGDFTTDQAVIGLRTQPVYRNALTPELL